LKIRGFNSTVNYISVAIKKREKRRKRKRREKKEKE